MAQDAHKLGLEQIYLQYRKDLQRFLYQFIGCPHQAEDISQEAFIRLQQADLQGRVEHPKPFLYTTARNLAFDKLRQDKRRGQVVVPEDGTPMDVTGVDADQPSAQAKLEGKELLARIKTTIQSMPDRRRKIFTMRRMQGMTLAAIAQELGICEATVRSEIKAALLQCHVERDRSS